MRDETVLATVEASAGRRLFAYATVVSLGVVLILLAFVGAPTIGGQIFLIALGVAILLVAEKLRRATTLGLVLDAHALRDTSGAVLTTIDNISSVDRGAFAFKPSNGFILRLNDPLARSWAPGIWWRMGRRIGVGGVTSSGPCKFMAERITMLLAERDR